MIKTRLIEQVPSSKKYIAPVSYTHLDVYKRQVMALAILVCVFAVLATSFAVDTSSESASFRVDAQIMGYNLSLIHI